MGAAGSDLKQAIEHAKARAEQAGVFASILLTGGKLECKADGAAEDAFYRVQIRAQSVVVSLDMQDRWLSESIESALMSSGDPLEELLDDELAELGYTGTQPTYQHFRDDDKRFIFETEVPVEGCSADDVNETVALYLLGYEACFRQLGDMDEDSSED